MPPNSPKEVIQNRVMAVRVTLLKNLLGVAGRGRSLDEMLEDVEDLFLKVVLFLVILPEWVGDFILSILLPISSSIDVNVLGVQIVGHLTSGHEGQHFMYAA